ncbi:unnamed protein product [Oreochromis niloticus]|nr:unnamed protein product [Mustela putorius furo]
MAKRSSTRKSLKSLFSKSEANLDESVEKDVQKNGGEKKRFKLFKFKIQSKNDSEKSANESQKMLRAGANSKTADDGEPSADNNGPHSKPPPVYATAPRVKAKELSYSETDLRKPKRFATISFGLRKKKKKDEENISKSTFGLPTQGIEEREEIPVEREPGNRKKFSMSQPELDSNSKFDIPSPPPVAANETDSYFTLSAQSQSVPVITVNTQQESKGPLTNASDLSDVQRQTLRAPIASIPELQLDDTGSLEEKENIPVHDSSSRNDAKSALLTATSETTSVVRTQAEHTLLASQPPTVLDSSAYEAATVDSGNNSYDYIPQENESTSGTLPYHQSDAPDTVDSTISNSESSLTSVDNSNYTNVTGPSPDPQNDKLASSADSAANHHEIFISHTERSFPETAKSVSTTSAVSSESSTAPVNQDKVYGALYESLFPQNFTSEVISSLLSPSPHICTDTTLLDTKTEFVIVKTHNESHAETNTQHSQTLTSRDLDLAAGGTIDAPDGSASIGEIKGSSFSESSRRSFSASQIQTVPENQNRYVPTSLSATSKYSDSAGIPYSELTRSRSELKSDNKSLVTDSVWSGPLCQNSAPPISDYETSHGIDAQVTDSKRRVILVKELVTDETNVYPGCSSSVIDKMNLVKDLKGEIEMTDGFSGPTVRNDRLLSPAYLSVGSDDDSTKEIYYSAEEDNAEESGDEEMFTIDEREESIVGLREEIVQHSDKEISQRDEGDFRVVIVKMEQKEGKIDDERKGEDYNGQSEVQQQLEEQKSGNQVHEMGTSESSVKEQSTTVWPQMKGEEEEEGRKDLLATPVQQVSTMMVCGFAPPSSEQHGQVEESGGNWTADLETEDHSNGENLFPTEVEETLPNKDFTDSGCIHAASSYTKEEDVIVHIITEEQVPLIVNADKTAEGNKDTEISLVITNSTLTDTAGAAEAVMGNLTHSAHLQSDATEIEHNRVPRSTEWVDTITQSPDRNNTVQVLEQVAVELSASNADTHHLDSDTAEGLCEHPKEAQPDLNEGSLTTSRTTTASSESQQTDDCQDSADKMNSGYRSLSTKLLIKTSSLSKEDEAKHRFRKLSLINDADATDNSQDEVDFRKTSTSTESNGTDLDSDYKWKNRFEGVSQYKPSKTENYTFSDSLTYSISDTSSSNYSSSSSALPDATAYTHFTDSFSSPSLPSLEEPITLDNRLSDRTEFYLSRESNPVKEPADDWRRSLVEQEEPAAAAGEMLGRREGESESVKSAWESRQLPVSGLSSTQQTSYNNTVSLEEEDHDSSRFTGVFTATLVEAVSDPVATTPSTPPASPDEDSTSQFDMEILVDTLKSMGPSLRQRNVSVRPANPGLISSLPPIVEDAPSPISSDVPDSVSSLKTKMEGTGAPAESLNGLYTLPADLGLKRTSPRDSRSPLELIRQNQDGQPGTRGLNLPFRASTLNSTVMRKSSDSSSEDLKSPVLNGNEVPPSPTTSSRLDHSVLFGNYKPSSTVQTQENGKAHRSVFRTSSLPETSKDRLTAGLKELGDLSAGTESGGSRFERLSFLMNSSSSLSGSLSGAEDLSTHMSRPASLAIGSPPASNSPTRLLSPTGSIDFHRPFANTDTPLSIFSQTSQMAMGVGSGTMGTPILQRSLSSDAAVGVHSSLFSNINGKSQFQSQPTEPDRNLLSKYRAFPDAYLTKEKEHGKLNPRPGKMYIFDRPDMCGQRIEVRGDVIDATPWKLQETISIRVVRGGWVLYEKPDFKGEKIALDEGDIEITYPFSPPEEQQENRQDEGEEQNGDTNDEQKETKPARRFIIGSIRRAVRDYSVPEIALFPEEEAEGKKVIFRDTSDDARIFGFPIKANSIIINAGLWLVFAQPFFQGVPRVLEVGGYANPAAWGVEQPYVGSLHPLKIGEPKVEDLNDPKMVIYEKPYFTGKSRTITTNMRDFMTRIERQQTTFMYSVGSLKVLGGIWVGYEKEGFRGHQYLLEEGEYHDWRVWGGCDAELRSVRVIRADLTDPAMVMFEQLEEDQEGDQEEKTFEVTEAIPDVELFGYKTSTRSIEVISGAWIAYSHVDFSGHQYILEKGFYNNCADWGSQDTRICSVQPILLAPNDSSRSRDEIKLYCEPDLQGECYIFNRKQEEVPEKLVTKSCRVTGRSWVLYENEQFSGNLYVLSEGDYPNLTSMGCPPDCSIRSFKIVPLLFSVPSISLFGLECLEGREITTDTEILSMVEEGFNNHILSLRVNSGCWVICEHSNYRGRQFLLEPIEITNWPKFSSLHTIGSMYPVRQKRHFFRIKNTERGHFLSVQGGVEELKSGRVVVTPEVEPLSDIWFYQDGLIKNKLSPTMSLQVVGNIEPAAKVVLWTETRQPVQTWTAQMKGLITSNTFPGMVLDVKGGKTYDKDHVVIMPENDERPSQQWEIELL